MKEDNTIVPSPCANMYLICNNCISEGRYDESIIMLVDADDGLFVEVLE